jgi:GNAT superfamily N-acetyltransferase
MNPSGKQQNCAEINRLAVVDKHTGLSLVPRIDIPLVGFDCGNADLNEWFSKDVVESTESLLVKNFELKLPGDPGGTPVVLVSLCNDAIRLRDLEEFLDVPVGKRFKSWPAVKISRLGVAKEHKRKGFGTEAIRLIKLLFTSRNRTGCRFITVEAYNTPEAKFFYESNGFDYMTGNDCNDETRHMWFDLITVEPRDSVASGL